MHNINYIRENPTEFDNLMKLRGEKPLSSKIIEIDKQKRETQTILQSLLAERNNISKTIGVQKNNNKDVSNEMKKIEEIKNKKLYRELNVSYELFDTDKKLDIKDFEYSDLKKILLQLKVLFEKRGYQINWKDLESQDVYQTLSALSMASPFSIQEKQMLLETKNLKDRKTKFEEILKTYNTDFYNSKTIQ